MSNTHSPIQSTEIISILFSKIPAADLRDRLLYHLRYSTSDPSDSDALLAILERLGFSSDITKAREAAADTTLLHCVRCHDYYQEKRNELDSCTVFKHELKEPEFYGAESRLWRCKTCGGRWADDEEAKKARCFHGFHTSIEDEVDTARTCEKRGCGTLMGRLLLMEERFSES